MKSNFKGAIFDFNGTLFWDTDFHDEAWMIFARKHGIEMSRERLRDELHGKVNRDIFRIVFGDHLSDQQAEELAEEKEATYRELMRANKSKLPIANGAFEFIESLVAKGIPIAIATSSPRSNVEFYKELLDLNRWFPNDRIVFDDGSFLGKPAPDIFLLAADRLGLAPTDCVIFEDALSGIQAGLSSGARKVYVLKSGNHLAWRGSDEKVELIDDFSGFLK